MDRRVLRDWEETVYKFIDEKIGSLKLRKINKRKKHVLKSRVHLDNLNKLHENFVLVYIYLLTRHLIMLLWYVRIIT